LSWAGRDSQWRAVRRGHWKLSNVPGNGPGLVATERTTNNCAAFRTNRLGPSRIIELAISRPGLLHVSDGPWCCGLSCGTQPRRQRHDPGDKTSTALGRRRHLCDGRGTGEKRGRATLCERHRQNAPTVCALRTVGAAWQRQPKVVPTEKDWTFSPIPPRKFAAAAHLWLDFTYRTLRRPVTQGANLLKGKGTSLSVSLVDDRAKAQLL